MPLPPIPLTNGAFFIDNSTIELFNTCPRAVQYSKLNARVTASNSAALTFGSAIHLALEHRYVTCANQPVDGFYNQDVAQLLADYYEANPVPVEDYRNLNWALETTKRYNDKYSMEEFSMMEFSEPLACKYCEGTGVVERIIQQLHANGEVVEIPQGADCVWCKGSGTQSLMVELPFATRLGNINQMEIYYSGRIDLPVIIDGKLFVLDHKTTSVLGPTFFDDKKMSAQQKGYAWAMEQLTGHKVHGYIVNAIRAKEPPQYVTQGKESKYSGKKMSPETWWNEGLQRERFLLNEGELDEWRENLLAQVEEFFWHYSRGLFPKKTAWCVGKYGRCQYFEVCSLYPPQDREVLLNSGLFMDNTWSPLVKPSQRKH